MFGFIAIALRNPLVRKALPYVLVGAAVLFTLRLWTNGIAERAAAQAKIKQVEAQLDTERKAWAEREKALEVQQKQLDAEWETLNGQRELLGKSRLSIKGELAQGIGSLKTELDKRQVDITRVPGTELDARIKQQLGALR